MMNPRGITLVEIMVAATLMFLVILAIGQVDVSRVRLSEEARKRGGSETDAAMALAHMGRFLQEADRVNLIGPTSLQFRRFIGNPSVAGALDNVANYRWAQYTLADVNPADGTMDTIQFNDDAAAGCGAAEDGFQATSLLLQYQDEAGAPPGGEPFGGDDNNLLLITVNGRFNTEVVIRGGAYTNVATGLSTAPGGPPASC